MNQRRLYGKYRRRGAVSPRWSAAYDRSFDDSGGERVVVIDAAPRGRLSAAVSKGSQDVPRSV